MSLAPTSFDSLLMWSPSGPLEEVYEYLTPTEAQKFSVTCKRAREIYIGERVQKALVHIHFPTISRDLSSFRRLFLKASVTKGAHAERQAKILCIQTLWGHNNTIYFARLLAGGKRALSVSFDNTLKIWDLRKDVCLQTLPIHSAPWSYSNHINFPQISADERRVLARFNNNTIKLWDLTTGACLHTLSEHGDLIYCIQMSADGTRALSGSFDKTLKLWDLTTGARLHTFSGHTGPICCLQMRADGGLAISGARDYMLKVWNLTTGECLHTLSGHTAWIQCLWMKADGTWALSGSLDDTLKLWDLSQGICLRNIFIKWIFCLDVSADGTRALSAPIHGSAIKFWDLTKGECLQTLEGHGSSIHCLQMSADKRRALSGSVDNTLRLWDLIQGVCLQILTGHRGDIICLQMSADGTRALSGSSDSKVKVWDLTSPLPEERISKVAKAVFENRQEAKELFLKLPQFVQEHITKALYALHVRLGKKRPSQLIESSRQRNTADVNYGRKALFREDGLSSEAQEREKVFYDYMRCHFLPDVAEYLKEFERQNICLSIKYSESILFKEARDRFDQLPNSLKQAVYKELYEIKKTAKTIPERASRMNRAPQKKRRPESEEPEERFTLESREQADFQETIQAIANVMALGK